MKNKTDFKKKLIQQSFFNKKAIILAGILIITFIGYYKTINFELLTWDDDKQIINNQEIKKFDGETFQKLYHFDRYTSITLLTFAWEYKNYKLNAKKFHLHNIYLHLINILLVFLLIRKLFGKDYVALFCALLFAIHPSRVESVAWVSERKDLLFTLFSLTSLLIYINYLDSKFKLIYLILFIITSYLSIHSKLQGIALIPLFFLLDYFYKRKITLLLIYEKFYIFFLTFVFLFDYVFQLYDLLPSIFVSIIFIIIYLSQKNTTQILKLYIFPIFMIISIYFSRKIMMLLPFFIWYIFEVYLFEKEQHLAKIKYNIIKYKNYLFISISLILIVFAFLIKNHFALWATGNNPTTTFYLYDRIFLGACSLLFYLGLFLFPFNLNSIHPYPIKTGNFLPFEYYISLIVCIILISLIIIFIYKRKLQYKREIIFSILFFIINISLVLHIIPIQGRIVYADRYSYFGFIGLFALAGLIYEEWKSWFLSNKWLGLIAALYIIIMASYAFKRINTWKDSLTLFSEVLQQNPDVSIAHNNIGAAMLKFSKEKETMFHLNRSIELDSMFYIAHYNRAMAYYQFKKYAEAENELHWLNTKQNDSLDQSVNLNDLGMIKIETGDFIKASEYLEHAKKLNPKYAKLYNNTGWLKYLQNDFKGAITDFNKCISIDPSMDDAFSNRGWCKLKTGDAQGAIEDFNLAVFVNPNNAKALVNRGTIKTNLNDIDGALTDFNKAIEINPAFEIAYANRGYAYFIKKDIINTIKDYSSAIKLNSKNPDYYSNRGWAYFQVANSEKALLDFDEAIALGKKDELTYTNRGYIKYRTSKVSDAEKDMDIALSINSNSWKANLFKGMILFDKNKFKNAIELFSKSIQFNKKNEEAYLFRGHCYLRLNKKPEACIDFEASIKLGNKNAKKIYDLECNKN